MSIENLVDQNANFFKLCEIFIFFSHFYGVLEILRWNLLENKNFGRNKVYKIGIGSCRNMSENVHFEGEAQLGPKKEKKRHPRIFNTFNLR